MNTTTKKHTLDTLCSNYSCFVGITRKKPDDEILSKSYDQLCEILRDGGYVELRSATRTSAYRVKFTGDSILDLNTDADCWIGGENDSIVMISLNRYDPIKYLVYFVVPKDLLAQTTDSLLPNKGE